FLQRQLAPDDPHKQAVYRNFQRNLESIVEAGRRSGAKILLSTVAVNLKDCPPLASIANSNLPAADRTKFAARGSEKLWRSNSAVRAGRESRSQVCRVAISLGSLPTGPDEHHGRSGAL